MGQSYFLRNKRYKQFTVGFLTLLLVYLLFHLFVSERSVTSLMSLSAQQTILEKRVAQLQQEKEELQMRVSRLRPETIDPDLLQEQAIRMLGRPDSNALILLDQQS